MNVAVILPADHQQIMKKMRFKFQKHIIQRYIIFHETVLLIIILK